MIITIQDGDNTRILFVTALCKGDGLCATSPTLCRYEVKGASKPDDKVIFGIQCDPAKKRVRSIQKAIETAAAEGWL